MILSQRMILQHLKAGEHQCTALMLLVTIAPSYNKDYTIQCTGSEIQNCTRKCVSPVICKFVLGLRALEQMIAASC